MRRAGDISPALQRFRSYASYARALEEYKPLTRGGSLNKRARAEMVCATAEERLDRAWVEVEQAAALSGWDAADMAADHFLMGLDWHDVASARGIPYDKCKKAAYEAIKALDEFGGQR